VQRILSLSHLKPIDIDSPWIGFGLRLRKFSFGSLLLTPGGRRVRLGGGLGPRGWCGLLGAAQGWHGSRARGGVDMSQGRRGGRERDDVLPAAMATGPIARPTVMGWSRPRQEVGRLWASRKEGEAEKLQGRLRFWPRSIVNLS
jgi:hypothetical protein